MFEILLIDLDDTVLDFKKAEHIAVEKTLKEFGMEPTLEVCQRYSAINQLHWEALERKEMTREQVLVGRFAMLFAEHGFPVDATACARCYEKNLSAGHYFLPGAEETVISLSKKYRLFLVSNGTARVQSKRLASAGIEPYFEKIFISQDVGINKPDKGYFDYCFARIPGFSHEKTLIVGDSLSSDILGGKNAGIATCWVNPRHKQAEPERAPDYEIESLSQLEALLRTL